MPCEHLVFNVVNNYTFQGFVIKEQTLLHNNRQYLLLLLITCEYNVVLFLAARGSCVTPYFVYHKIPTNRNFNNT